MRDPPDAALTRSRARIVIGTSVLARAWRILSWKHWAWSTVIAGMVALSMPLQNVSGYLDWNLQKLAGGIRYLAIAYVMVVAIVLVEAASRRPAGPSTWQYLGAVVGMAGICVAVAGTFPHLFLPRSPTIPAWVVTILEGGSLDVGKQAMVVIGSNALLHGALATFIYVRIRRARIAARALAAAELERSEAARKLLDSELAAAQSQVNPVYVLRELELIEEAYERDSLAAEAMLDGLIGFLRDAIPRLRGEDFPERAA